VASFPTPAPQSNQDQQGQGPGPGGGFASPAPAVEDQGAAQMLKLSLGIVSAARMLAQRVPAVTPEVQQINDLVARMQAKIKAQQAPAESQAPPV